MYVYIYVYMYLCLSLYVERARERARARAREIMRRCTLCVCVFEREQTDWHAICSLCLTLARSLPYSLYIDSPSAHYPAPSRYPLSLLVRKSSLCLTLSRSLPCSLSFSLSISLSNPVSDASKLSPCAMSLPAQVKTGIQMDSGNALLAKLEFPLFTKDPRREEVLLNANTRRDVTGKVIGMIGVGHDAPEHKHAELEMTRVAASTPAGL